MSSDSTRLRRVLFAHDGPVEVGPDGVPRGIHFTPALLDRYLQLGSELTFLLRAKPVGADEAARYTPLVRNGFRFVPVADVKGPLKQLVHGRSLREQIRDEVGRHDIFVVRLPSTLGRRTYNEARRQGKPVLIEFVACTWDSLWNYSLLGKLLAPYYYLKNRQLLRTASHVIYVTERFLQRRYPTQGKWIACSNVVVETSDPAVLKSRLQRIGADNEPARLTLTTIAAVDVRYKDQSVVLRALAALGDAGRCFRYRLIGQGNPLSLKALAQKLGIADQVEFVGAVPHAEIPGWLDETDVYIQPSRQEGLPRALIEAMSRGCPALGSNAGGTPELLPASRIFGKGDYHTLSKMLLGMTPADMQRDARRNFEKAAEFDARVLESRRKAFFEEFLCDNEEERMPAPGRLTPS